MPRPRPPCSKCNWGRLPGLRVALCSFHWAEGVWGLAWASRCHPDHPGAIPGSKPFDLPGEGAVETFEGERVADPPEV